MKKRILILFLSVIVFMLVLSFGSCENENSQNVENPAIENELQESSALMPTGPFTPVTGWDMMAKMGIGLNTGNTLDANGDIGIRQGLESETMWGAERIEKWQFETMKIKGIDSVRIPVTWGNHMDLSSRKIDDEWMDRVQECVDMALEAGLIVMINTHHEHFLYDFMVIGEHEGVDYGDGDFEGAAKWLDDIWGQIAERFKDYPETLIFEPMNEPSPGGSVGPGWYWDRNGDWTDHPARIAKLNDLTNRLNRHVLATIRNSGGNNDKRIVVNSITQADPHQIHQYEHTFDDPYTMLGIFFYTDSDWNNNGVLTRSDEQIMIDKIKNAMEQGIPIVLKETLPIGITDTERANTWAKTWYPKLAELGAVPMWWNCYGQPPGEMFDRWSGRWVDDMVDIVFSAYGKTPGASVPPPPEVFDRIFDDRGQEDNGTYWFGGLKLRDALTEYKYFIVEIDTDELIFQLHSGKNGYTDIQVPGTRIIGTNWWYIETAEPISNHSGTLEEIGWWFQIKLLCYLNTDNGMPRAMVSDTLPV